MMIDIAFVRNPSGIPLALRAEEIFVPSTIDVHGYSRTSRTHFDYVCWKRTNGEVILPDRRGQPEKDYIAVGYRLKLKIKTPTINELKQRLKEKSYSMVKPILPSSVSDVYFESKDLIEEPQKEPCLDKVGVVPHEVRKLKSSHVMTKQLMDVISGTSPVFQKEVESVLRLNLIKPMSIKHFEDMMLLQFRNDYDKAIEHVVLLREEGLLEQDSQTISPNFSQCKISGYSTYHTPKVKNKKFQ